MADPIEEEIQQEIKKHKILIYGKGTKAMPMEKKGELEPLLKEAFKNG